MEDFKIEKGIPVPERFGVTKWPLRDLEVGDSVLLPLNKKSNFSNIIAYLQKRYDLKFTTRKVSPTQFRVWRVK